MLVSMKSQPSLSVRLVRDFVNTAEPQLGTDQLLGSSAAECLNRLGFSMPDAPIGDADLALLVRVREGVRELLLRHAGHHEGHDAIDRQPDPQERSERAALDEALGDIPLTLLLSEGTATLRAVRDRPAHRVVAAVVTAVITTPAEEWERLKVCARDSCRWAFYDTSRNRSGRWCSMAGCGNIVKMRRAHRAGTNRGSAGVLPQI